MGTDSPQPTPQPPPRPPRDLPICAAHCPYAQRIHQAATQHQLSNHDEPLGHTTTTDPHGW